MKYDRKKREHPGEIKKKLDEDAMLCNTPCGQTHKKHFLPFRVLLNVGIIQTFHKKSFFFWLYSGKKNFAFRPKHFELRNA